MAAFAKKIFRRASFAYRGAMFKPADLFDLSQTRHAALFEGCEFAWDALKRLKEYLEKFPNLGPTGFRKILFAVNMLGAPFLHPMASRRAQRAWIGPKVLIGEGTVIEDGVIIKGPAIIGRDCEIRHGAYIRENVIIGDGCMVGSAQCSVLSGSGNRQRSTCNALPSVVAFFLCPPDSGFSRPRRPAQCGFSRFQRVRTQSRSAGPGSFCGLFQFSHGLVSGRVPNTDSPCPAVSGALLRRARLRRMRGRRNLYEHCCNAQGENRNAAFHPKSPQLFSRQQRIQMAAELG